jgi:hypothetical protein
VELNGAVVPPQEEIVLAPRRDRVDCNAEEATYVGTYNIRSNGSLKFEVAASTEGELIVRGVLDRSEAPLKGFGGYGVPLKTEWNLELSFAVSSIGCCFIKVDPLDFDTPPSQPIVEVCLVGKYETALVPVSPKFSYSFGALVLWTVANIFAACYSSITASGGRCAIFGCSVYTHSNGVSEL